MTLHLLPPEKPLPVLTALAASGRKGCALDRAEIRNRKHAQLAAELEAQKAARP